MHECCLRDSVNNMNNVGVRVECFGRRTQVSDFRSIPDMYFLALLKKGIPVNLPVYLTGTPDFIIDQTTKAFWYLNVSRQSVIRCKNTGEHEETCIT